MAADFAQKLREFDLRQVMSPQLRLVVSPRTLQSSQCRALSSPKVSVREGSTQSSVGVKLIDGFGIEIDRPSTAAFETRHHRSGLKSNLPCGASDQGRGFLHQVFAV